MAELTTKQRRAGLDFADKIVELASKALDVQTKKELYSVVNSVRVRFGFTQGQKRVEIWKRIHIGARTLNDLTVETQFTRNSVSQVLSEFEKAGLIHFTKLGSVGRPQLMIVPDFELKDFTAEEIANGTAHASKHSRDRNN
jgi:hypothetical protein